MIFWQYNSAGYEAMLQHYATLHESVKMNPNFAIMFTVFKQAPVNPDVLKLYVMYGDVEGPAMADRGESIFGAFENIAAAHNMTVRQRIVDKDSGVSSMINNYFRFRRPREFDLPFHKQFHVTEEALTPDFISQYVAQIAKIMDPTNGVFYVSEFVHMGPKRLGRDTATADNVVTGGFGFSSETFYIPPQGGHTTAMQNSLDHYEEMINVAESHPVFKTKSRLVWATFGDVNIHKVWWKYYPARVYFKLRAIKSIVDKWDIFSTSFTIPPLFR